MIAYMIIIVMIVGFSAPILIFSNVIASVAAARYRPPYRRLQRTGFAAFLTFCMAYLYMNYAFFACEQDEFICRISTGAVLYLPWWVRIILAIFPFSFLTAIMVLYKTRKPAKGVFVDINRLFIASVPLESAVKIVGNLDAHNVKLTQRTSDAYMFRIYYTPHEYMLGMITRWNYDETKVEVKKEYILAHNLENPMYTNERSAMLDRLIATFKSNGNVEVLSDRLENDVEVLGG